MTESIVLDTGPLVAFLNRRDYYHDWTLSQWARLAPPMFTCEAVVSEALFLLLANGPAANAVLDLLQRGVLALPFSLNEHIQNIDALLKKYRSVPMSLADACLVRMSEVLPQCRVRMSEVLPQCRVLTFDSDFSLYRRNGRRVIPTLAPPSRGTSRSPLT